MNIKSFDWIIFSCTPKLQIGFPVGFCPIDEMLSNSMNWNYTPFPAFSDLYQIFAFVTDIGYQLVGLYQLASIRQLYISQLVILVA